MLEKESKMELKLITSLPCLLPMSLSKQEKMMEQGPCRNFHDGKLEHRQDIEDTNDSDLSIQPWAGIIHFIHPFIYSLTHHLFSKDSIAVGIVALVSKGTKITGHSICL